MFKSAAAYKSPVGEVAIALAAPIERPFCAECGVIIRKSSWCVIMVGWCKVLANVCNCKSG
jgi:hypothetical protein